MWNSLIYVFVFWCPDIIWIKVLLLTSDLWFYTQAQRSKTTTFSLTTSLHPMLAHAKLAYRAGRLLYPCLDPEGCCADVLKAEELWSLSGDDPELADSSGFWRLHEHKLWALGHFGVVDLYVPVEELFLAKVLQTLGFNEGGSAACAAVTEGLKGGSGVTGTQT